MSNDIVESSFKQYLAQRYSETPDEQSVAALRYAYFTGVTFLHQFSEALHIAANGNQALFVSVIVSVDAELTKFHGGKQPSISSLDLLPARKN